MCGISVTNLNFDSLKISLSELSHRGQDEVNFAQIDNIILGHNRLHITGKDKNTQPFNYNGIGLVVNGEIYNNYKTILTDSDSEIILQKYINEGLNFLNDLNGEFSFVLYDSNKKKIFFARDRFGIKPLYFKIVNNQFMICSEMKGLKKIFKPKINHEAIRFMLRYQYLYPSETIFSYEECLPSFIYQLDLETFTLSKKQYYDLNYEKENISYEESIRYTKEILSEAIQIRIPKINFGTYLSGGLDSSIITTLSSKNDNLKSIFCATFKNVSELDYANIVAKNIKKELTEIKISESLENIKKIVYLSEGTSINSHFLAKYQLSNEMNKQQIKTILTGEGADEFFFGYSHFKKEQGLSLNNKEKLIHSMQVTDKYIENNFYNKIGMIPSFVMAKLNLFDFLFTDKEENDFLENKFLSILPKQKVDISQYLWVKYALSGYILRTLDDGLGMANTVESRLPFLDYNVVNFANKIPREFHFLNGEKTILKESFRNELPDVILTRTKQSFLEKDNFKNNHIVKEKIMNGFVDVKDNYKKLTSEACFLLFTLYELIESFDENI